MATLATAHGFGHALALFPFIYLLAFVATIALPRQPRNGSAIEETAHVQNQ